MIKIKKGAIVQIDIKGSPWHKRIGIITAVDYFDDYPLKVKIGPRKFSVDESDVITLDKKDYPEYLL